MSSVSVAPSKMKSQTEPRVWAAWEGGKVYKSNAVQVI